MQRQPICDCMQLTCFHGEVCEHACFLLKCTAMGQWVNWLRQLQSWSIELSAVILTAKSGWRLHKWKDSLSRLFDQLWICELNNPLWTKQYSVIPAQSFGLLSLYLKIFLRWLLAETAWPDLLISLESFSYLSTFTIFSFSRFKSPVKGTTRFPFPDCMENSNHKPLFCAYHRRKIAAIKNLFHVVLGSR